MSPHEQLLQTSRFNFLEGFGYPFHYDSVYRYEYLCQRYLHTLHCKEETLCEGRHECLQLVNKASECTSHKCFVFIGCRFFQNAGRKKKPSPLTKWLTSVYIEFCYETNFRVRYRVGYRNCRYAGRQDKVNQVELYFGLEYPMSD